MLQAKVHKKERSGADFRTFRRKSQSSPTAFNPIALLSRSAGKEEIQAKLKIGPPGDIYEQEAGRISEQVMTMQTPTVQKQTEEEESLQTKPLIQGHVEEEAVQSQKDSEKPKTRPTGIEKTEVERHKLHFGALYKHTLKSSGGSLEGIHVTEKVTVEKDDFRTKLPGVKLGVHKAPINKKGEISDRIWISFGALAPSVNRLRKKKKSGESLLGTKVNHQELHYWDNSKPPGWKKFTDIKIEQRLYDLPGLVVVTMDNSVMAQQENFTVFAPRKEE